MNMANWDNIQEDLCKLSDSIMNTVKCSSIEELWKTFKDGIQHSMDRNIPSKVRSKRKSLPWFNSNLKKMVWRKSRLTGAQNRSQPSGVHSSHSRNTAKGLQECGDQPHQ